MDIREIPVDELVLDPDLNLRDRLDDFAIERYADAWERMPPITVFAVDGRLLVADGFHRHAAAVRLGRKALRAEVREGTFADALDFASSVNLFHGLPFSRAERRRAVEVKLRIHHDWSDRRLAEELGVSRELVARTRRMLVDGGQIPNHPGRVGSDGKTYPSAGLPRDPNERLPQGKPVSQQEDPRDRGGRESDPPPWEDTTTPLPPVTREPPPAPPWEAEFIGAKKVALSDPAPASAPTIDEMLQLMARQVTEVLAWTQAEGFAEAYLGAGASARGVFHAAVSKLAARADQLGKP